jgi:nicotinamidase/pyrazinamidase
MKALILVDIQNDFVPGGALAVPDGDKVVPVANRLMSKFPLVVATQDWHPAEHGSFAAHYPGKKPGDMIELSGLPQILWPVHCVENTKGAEFVSGLETRHIHHVIQKGTDPRIDSYSGFFDNGHRKATGLSGYLKEANVRDVYVMGLATDYCVKFTALDARAQGFNTYLIEDGSRGVNLKPDDVANAINEMKKTGVKLLNSSDI